jgi:hypothetical protein
MSKDNSLIVEIFKAEVIIPLRILLELSAAATHASLAHVYHNARSSFMRALRYPPVKQEERAITNVRAGDSI